MPLKNIITMRNYTYALILITSLILLATIVHNASADVQYYEEAWFLRNNTETIVDNVSAIVKTNDGIIHIKMNETYLNDYFNYVSAKSKEKERIRKKWGMNDTEIRKTREYPVHLYKKVYNESKNNLGEPTITLVDVSHKLKSRSVNLYTKNAYIDIKNIDIKNDDYVLKIGFHTITYDSGTNTITVTGYTEATPCTFTDIYNADVANGWGVVSKQGKNQFLLQCRLYVGDGSTDTWMRTVEEQITFETNGCGSWKNVLYIKTNATFTSGILISESKRQGKHGSSITVRITDVGDINPIFKVSSSGIVYLYATHISCINSSTLWIRDFNSDCRIYQTVFTDCRSLASCNGVDVQNLLWVGNNYALEQTYFSTDSAYIWAFGGIVDVYTPPHEELGQPPITNFYAEILKTWSASADYIGGLRNFLGSLPLPTPIWKGSPSLGCYIKWYADMDLKITDKDNNNIIGATITVKNKNGDIQFSTDTDANGDVSETVWVVKDEWSGSGSSNTRTDYNPFTLEIKKAGYQTYTQKFTLYKKIDWTIALNSAAENGTTTETKLISTQVGAHKTTMAAAFMLLSGMFMMMAIKRRQEDE